MRLQEDFIRCQNCNSPYFRYKEIFSINKTTYELSDIIVPKSTYRVCFCDDCGYTLNQELIQK